jgi:hypothetical protein
MKPTTRRRSATLLAFALAFAAQLTLPASPSWASKVTRTDDEIRQAVQTLVRDRHPKDTPAHWRNLGSRAPGIIQGMYDSENSTYRRMRMLEGLGYFTEDPNALAFVKKQAETDPNEVVRHAAMRSIGQNQAAAQEEWLGGFLKHDNAHTRLLAAEMLRKAATPSAEAKVAAMMDAEKTPWVLAALRGEAPATPQLKPSGSTEDRLSPDFTGTWRGLWTEPQSAQKGIKSEAAELKLSLEEGGGKLKGLLKAGAYDFEIKEAVGKSLRWTGRLVEIRPAPGVSPSPKPSLGPFAIEAELARRAGHLLLEIRAPQAGILLILRRD